MSTRRCKVLLSSVMVVLALATVCPSSLWAGTGFQPVNPEELKMTGDPKAPGAPAIILYRQVDRDDNGRTSHEDNYYRVKILTEEGRKYADVEIVFAKGRNDVIGIRARTIKPDGSIRDFDGKVFEKTIEKSRATYQKRYGNTVAASANYFQHEIIRSLAEDDLSIMGANFRQ